MNRSIDSTDDPVLIGGRGFARIERTFANLFNLVKARSERSDQLQRQAQKKRPTRSEIYRQVQHEKWLGGSHAQPSAPPPKDLYKRVLLDPNTALSSGPGAKSVR